MTDIGDSNCGLYARNGIDLAEVNMIALRLPNVDAATNRGMHHAITPSILSANVYIRTTLLSASIFWQG